MNNNFKTLTSFFIAFCFMISAFAQSPNSAYVVQPNDWLSKISKTAYGDAQLYNRIFEATNEKAASDNSFKSLTDIHSLRVGQKIWIPALTKPAVSQNMEKVPATNCEIRLWYNYQVVAIGAINKKWEQDGLDLETRAHKAFEMRHEARVNARFMMQNKDEVKALQDRDMKKYGNPNGPTFDYLVKKNTDKGLSKAEAYQSIIDSSSRTDSKYNEDCQ